MEDLRAELESVTSALSREQAARQRLEETLSSMRQ